MNITQLDNRHLIRNPYGSAGDMKIWKKTLLKERVATLFLTQEGIKGHAKQIEQELNRLAQTEGQSQTDIILAVAYAKHIRRSIIKVKVAANHRGLHWRW